MISEVAQTTLLVSQNLKLNSPPLPKRICEMFFFKKGSFSKNFKSHSAGPDLNKEIPRIIKLFSSHNLDGLDFIVDLSLNTTPYFEEWLRDLRIFALFEIRRIIKKEKLHVFLKRQEHAQTIERIRNDLGYWKQSTNAPRYSVCVCNFNMADTMERAISSVASQLDPKLYEILVIDDGSTDNSLDVLAKLTEKYTHFRYISLPRDSRRRLGETRNLSIRAARGEYVLIHIDADDEWEPYLSDLVTLYHRMEQFIGFDFLLAGQQTGIAKRDFLLRYGPYENIYRYEDRNMMMRLAKENRLFFLDYRVYRTRLSRPLKKKIFKTIHDSCSALTYEIYQSNTKFNLIKEILKAPFFGSKYHSLKVSLLRALLIIPIYIVSRLNRPITNPITWEQFHQYHEGIRGTYPELMLRWEQDPDISFLSPKSQKIYSYHKRNKGLRSSR